MEKQEVNLQKHAMRYGTYMGIFWVAKFALFPTGLTNPLLMLLFLLCTLAVPFVSYFMARSFRNTYCKGFIRFPQAWIFTTFMYMFAALLVAVAHYVYFAYIDQGYIVNTYASLIEEVRAMNLPAMDAYLTQMEQLLELARNFSPIELTIQLLSQNVIYGSILALIVALFVKRTPPTLPTLKF